MTDRNSILWLGLFLPLYLLCSFRVLIRSRCRPLLSPAAVLKLPLQSEHCEGLSPLQAVSTSLAATVGTGNIVGTAQAIAMGGPGSLFWIWIAGLLGAAVKYAELALSQELGCGPIGLVRRAIGPFCAKLYALLALLSSLLMGNLSQVCVMTDTVLPNSSGWLARLLFALLLMALLAWILRSGVLGVGRAAEALVPLMALLFLGVTTWMILALHRHFSMGNLLATAFRPRSMLAASLHWGLRRGVFSHEAGLGTAAFAHEGLRSSDPAHHALWGVFEVFADTLIATMTGFVILCSGVPIPTGKLPGPELFRSALMSFYGPAAGSFFSGVFLLCFCFSTVMGCAVFARKALLDLFPAVSESMCRAIYCSLLLLGTQLHRGLIFQAADTINGLTALPVLCSLFLLAPLLSEEKNRRSRPGT